MTACALPVKAVLIDLDGTLLDTVPDLARRGQRHARRPRPCRRSPSRTSAPTSATAFPNLVKRVLAGELEAADDPAPPPADALASFKKHYAARQRPRSQALPRRDRGPAGAQGHGPAARRASPTRPQAFTVPLLERTGLAPYFELIVSGDTLPQQKPDPMPLSACLRPASASRPPTRC